MRLLTEYGGAFVGELSPPAIPEDERAALREYVSTGLKAAVASVAEHGHIVHITVAAEEGTRQVTCLTAVLHLLSTSDGEWAKEETESLPEWVRQPSGLAALEGLTLQAHRPLTAFGFSQHAGDGKEGAPGGVVRYLQAKGREARSAQADLPSLAADRQCRQIRPGSGVSRICRSRETRGPHPGTGAEGLRLGPAGRQPRRLPQSPDRRVTARATPRGFTRYSIG